MHFWKVRTHYLLYPNPYPKAKQMKSRWYGHPSFPLILQLGGDILVRSNWETYLNEFAQAVLVAGRGLDRSWRHDKLGQPLRGGRRKGPVPRVTTEGDPGWSIFERKYDQAGEATFELTLTRSKLDLQP